MSMVTGRPANPETARRERLLRGLFVFLALIVPTLLGYIVLYQWHTPMMGFIYSRAEPHVVGVMAPNSPADEAGLRSGDVIIAANGAPLDTWHDVEIKMGEIHTLAIVRDGQPLVLSARVMPMLYASRWQMVAATILTLTLWGAGTLLLWRRFQQRDVRLLFLLAQCLALAFLVALSFPFDLVYSPGWVVFVTYICLYLSVPLFLHFHMTFPVVLGTPRRRCLLLVLLYGLALAAAAGGISRTAPWKYWAGLYAIVVVAVVIGVILYVYRRRAAAADRRRLRLIVFGTVLGVTPLVVGYAVPNIVTQDTSYTAPLWLMSLFLIIPPLSYLYATARHNLFGIDRLLNRTLVYAILSLGLFVLYAGLIALLYRYLPGEWLPQAGTVAVVTLLVGLAFDRLRQQVQRWVDTLFFGGWYDYPGVVETISAALSRSLDREQLAHVLTHQTPDLMQLHAGQVWIGEAGAAFQEKIPAPQLQFPLSFQGQVRGLWTVGARRDGDGFSAADRRILQTLASQAEIALNNVLLVETLRRQIDEIRETQHQLLRSREQERARLARDLHDGPIQVLVGLNLQMGLMLSPTESRATSHEDAPQVGSVREMRAEVRELLSSLRQVCAELRPPMLDTLGLGAALRALAADWSAQHGVAVQLDLAPDATIRPLSGEVTVNLYRVAQEALSNVARHAAARRVVLRLDWEDSHLALTIRDDGRGFSVPATFRDLITQGHFGLAGIQERVELIGGELMVASVPSQGTTVRVVKAHVERQAQNVRFFAEI
jgi:signal transduction histidine kinase